jgi:hypothetical protein
VDSADRTITVKPAGELAGFVAGFVAAEGSFIVSGRRFAFGVGLAAADAATCALLAELLGVGAVTDSRRRRPHYDDEVTFRVNRLRELVDVVVPFMDEHLPASYKRQQYEAWRAKLLDYWETKARRRERCAVEGCELPRRAKGLCRGHYYREYGV